MIGWWTIVSTQSPQERDDADPESRTAAILAQWEAGEGGIRWIERLVREGKATKLAGGGYPNRYTARASDVLPLIESGAIRPPKNGMLIFNLDEDEEFVRPPDWMGKTELFVDRMAACPADQVLTIDAWDQS